jgi:putative transposase
MTDDQLAKQYPPIGNETESFVVRYRREWNIKLAPIIADQERIWSGECTLHSLIKEKLGVSIAGVQRIYEVLYRFWAAGGKPTHLLPATDRSGNRAQRRAGTTEGPLGRRRLARADNKLKNDNFRLTLLIIEEMQTAWRRLVRGFCGPWKAYRLYLAAKWTERWVDVGGKLTPILKRRGQRPSFYQWVKHGTSQDTKERAFRKMLGERQFSLKARALTGRRSPSTYRTGAQGELDACSGDTYLRSVFDRQRTVGTCRVIFVVDRTHSYIYGFYVGWRVNSESVRLALLHAASDKVSFCARYGRTITPDQWRSVLFPIVYGDHGELNCEESREDITGLKCSVVYARTGQADDKPVVEQTHHRMHIHDQPGSTHGRNRVRGEPDPASEALYNIEEFTADLIDAVLWANNNQVVRDLLKSWMPNTVIPTRAGIETFSRSEGYHVNHLHYHRDELIVNLCPKYRATITRKGVYLLVPRFITHGDELQLKRYCFRPPDDLWIGWSEKVAREGIRDHIEVFVVPFDLSRIYYLHPQRGLVALDLITDDPTLAAKSVLEDAVLHMTWDKIRWEDNEEDELQAAVARDLDQVNRRERAKRDLKRAQAEGAATPGGNSSSGRRVARKDEEAQGGHAPYAAVPRGRKAKQERRPSGAVDREHDDFELDDDADQAVEAWLDS